MCVAKHRARQHHAAPARGWGLLAAALCLAVPIVIGLAFVVPRLGSGGGDETRGTTFVPDVSPEVTAPPSGRVATWAMDESPPPGLAVDSSANGHDGQVTDVQVGVPGMRRFAYRFNGRSSRVEVPNASALNPEMRNFSYSVAVRLRSVPPGNDTFDLLRKGNTTSIGGEYKVEIVNINGKARARCTAGDLNGVRLGATPRTPSLADGKWHVITCSRLGVHWSAEVDGVTAQAVGRLGRIDNNDPLTMGAKMYRLKWQDYFPGDLDEASVTMK